MLVSDTLLAASADDGTSGTLGALSDEVRGGWNEVEGAADCEPLDLLRALPPLDFFRNPFFAEPLRGDASLVVRIDPGGFVAWMALDADALARATALGLVPGVPDRAVSLIEPRG